MSLRDIQTALDNHLSLFQSEHVAWEGTEYEPLLTQPYLSTRISARSREALGFGADSAIMWQGFYQINVSYPVNEGTGAVYGRVDELIDHFPRGLTLSSGDATVKIEMVSPQPTIQEGHWVTVPVLVRWFSTEP